MRLEADSIVWMKEDDRQMQDDGILYMCDCSGIYLFQSFFLLNIKPHFCLLWLWIFYSGLFVFFGGREMNDLEYMRLALELAGEEPDGRPNPMVVGGGHCQRWTGDRAGLA